MREAWWVHLPMRPDFFDLITVGYLMTSLTVFEMVSFLVLAVVLLCFALLSPLAAADGMS